MNSRTKTGLEILQVAAVIGLLGNLLLRQTPWGLNAFLFVTAFAAAMIGIAFRHRRELLTPRTLALHGAMIFFASMFLIRDAEELLVWDTLAIIVLMGVLVLPNFGVNQRIAGVFHYVAGFIWSGINSALAPFVLFGADVDWRSMPGSRLSRGIFSVARGLAVALPLVMIFGALFMAADAAYEGMVNRALYFEIDTIVSHIVLTSVFAWLTAGYFRGTLIKPFIPRPSAETFTSPIPKDEAVASTSSSFVDKIAAETAEDTGLPNNATVLEHINLENEPPSQDGAEDLSGRGAVPADDPAEKKQRDWQNFDNSSFASAFTLGTVETVIILGLLDALFLSFVIFQLPYLFGGMALVQATPDLSLADFARRGFGELVAVAALVLPILLVSHWLLRREVKRLETVFRVLAGIQIGLLFVIMASAMQRLVLLTGELGYGWTTVRFYPMVLMIWLAVVFVWFGWTVLRGKRSNFAWGALWSAIVMLAATNLMNPHSLIASKNIELMQQGREYDVFYADQLSADAVPAIVAGLPSMSLEDQCSTKMYLHNTYRDLGAIGDLRSLNYSRMKAFYLLRDVDPPNPRNGRLSDWDVDG